MHHSLAILVKMDPDDKDTNGPSLGLTVSESISETHLDVISALEPGDKIYFNATLVGMGDLSHLHHLHTFGIKRGEGKHEIQSHMHDIGRYKIKDPHAVQSTKE